MLLITHIENRIALRKHQSNFIFSNFVKYFSDLYDVINHSIHSYLKTTWKEFQEWRRKKFLLAHFIYITEGIRKYISSFIKFVFFNIYDFFKIKIKRVVVYLLGSYWFYIFYISEYNFYYYWFLKLYRILFIIFMHVFFYFKVLYLFFLPKLFSFIIFRKAYFYYKIYYIIRYNFFTYFFFYCINVLFNNMIFFEFFFF